MSRWFRVYSDLIDDPKFIKLGPDLRSALLMTWCVASGNDGHLPSLQDIAIKFRLSEPRTLKLLNELRHCGFIDDDETGSSPHNWSGRQYLSDEQKVTKGKDSYVYIIGRVWGAEALKIGFSKNPWARVVELQTAHHEKLSVLATFKCNSHSEVDLHDILKPYRKSGEWFALPTTIYVAISNAAARSSSYDDLVAELRELLRRTTTETEAEAKTEATSEKKDIRAVADATRPDADHAFDEFWEAYPSRGDAANPKKPAKDRFSKLLKSGIDAASIIAAAKRYSEIEREAGRIRTEKVAQAITWLNQHRWQDYAENASATSPMVSGFYATAASHELQAWDDFNRQSTGKTLPRDSKGGWLVPAQWPPEQETAH